MARPKGIPNARRDNEEMDKITFILPAELKRKLAAVCTREGVSMTQEICRLVELDMSDEVIQPEPSA